MISNEPFIFYYTYKLFQICISETNLLKLELLSRGRPALKVWFHCQNALQRA